MPEKDEVIEFKNYSHKIRVPFCIYADFKYLLSDIEDDVKDEIKP